LAAYTAAMLNNQPMGFYSPATLVKDAQRHGLKVKCIDVARSDWSCTLEQENDAWAVRLGLRYVKGLREGAVQALVAERAQRSFESLDDLVRRVPHLRKDELVTLAEVGALNSLGAATRGRFHRRTALWQIERAVRPTGALLEKLEESAPDSPLNPMTPEERLIADFRSAGLTVGKHPMAWRRAEMQRLGVYAAADLHRAPDGQRVRIAGCVICRQRPGTAKGFVFLSIEDETGIANVIVAPDLFQRERVALTQEPFLLVEGVLQNQDHVISIKAERILPLAQARVAIPSHDFR
ncbi:MAG TPA: OB-fold nucleic acid binding domain-containing protein, partial [Terriglobia bacterium]|nr:OB-fold nucleic acid binding domain-containing protein [Terriglobia bacterium]